MTVSHPAGHVVVAGLENIFGEMADLVARARAHEDTDVKGLEVGRRGTVIAFAVTIGTRSGEDLRTAYLQSSVWMADSRSQRSEKLWSGSGGEFHYYFDACLFGTEMSYILDSTGTITRHCQRTIERHADAKQVSSCSSDPPMACSDGVIGTLRDAAAVAP